MKYTIEIDESQIEEWAEELGLTDDKECEECALREMEKEPDPGYGLESLYQELRRGEIGPACREYVHHHLGRIL